MNTWHREAQHLRELYDIAVGDALALGIKVYDENRPGRMKSLGELWDEIAHIRTYTPRHRLEVA